MTDQEQTTDTPGAEADDSAESTERLQQARDKFSAVAAKAKSGGEQVREKAKRGGEQMRETAEQVREKAGRAGDAAKEKYDVAVENIKQGYDKVQTDLDQVLDEVNDYVRANPGRSIVIAAGLGFFIGMLVRSRR